MSELGQPHAGDRWKWQSAR